MTKNNSKDLTVGSPTGLILGFSSRFTVLWIL